MQGEGRDEAEGVGRGHGGSARIEFVFYLIGQLILKCTPECPVRLLGHNPRLCNQKVWGRASKLTFASHVLSGSHTYELLFR